MRILFIDNTTPQPYDYSSLVNGSMGGTEATLLRVAKGLAKTHVVSILQHNRVEEMHDEDVHFITMESMFSLPEVVIHLRVTAHVPVYKAIFPKAKHYAWMHDLATDYYKQEMDELESLDGIIYVSDFHKRQFEQMLKSLNIKMKLPQGHVIYNIVDTEQSKSIEPFNENRLLFASSPHKGLDQVIDKFQLLRDIRPNLELGIMNPGYIELENIEEKDGIKVYGVKTHKDYLSIVARSALVFYPQYVFPETFGLVLAEANAVYTPVVCHNFGAAREVLTDPTQAIDCTNNTKVIDKALALIDTQPDVSTLGPKKEFEQAEVIKQWEVLLGQS